MMVGIQWNAWHCVPEEGNVDCCTIFCFAIHGFYEIHIKLKDNFGCTSSQT